MEQKRDIDELTRLVVEGGDQEILSFLKILHPADIADLLESLDDSGRRRLLELMDHQTAADVISEVEDPYLEDMVKRLRIDELSKIVGDMDSDDAADLLSELSDEEVRAVLAILDAEDVAEIGELMRHPEDTAGGIMQAELVALKASSTVSQAIDEIRAQADEVRKIHNIYVVDDSEKLVGVASLRELILADPNSILDSVMTKNVIKARVDMDQEEVADQFRRYDLVSLPVEDVNGKLVGRVTVDDIVDVLDEEADEDFLKMAGSVEEEVLSSFGKSVRARFPWLLASWIGMLITSVLIGKFLDSSEKLILFVPFLPLILGMGGNVGGQSATVVVRGIATGKLDARRMWQVAYKEVGVGFALGAIYGLLLGVCALFLGQGPNMMALIVGLSLTIQLAIAATSGVLLPIIFHRLNTDPALATAPFITTIMDIVGATLYFSMALIVIGRS